MGPAAAGPVFSGPLLSPCAAHFPRRLHHSFCKVTDMELFPITALGRARKLKPEIPLVSEEGIPIRHELEFERLL